MRFIYDTNTMGVSQRTLDALKNALSVGSKKVKVDTVLQINTIYINCGFAVIYSGEDEHGEKEFICYFTGDGFRTDGGGEGGRAYAKAQEVLHKKGIEPTVIDTGVKPSTTAYEYIGHIVYAIEVFLFNERDEEITDECKSYP